MLLATTIGALAWVSFASQDLATASLDDLITRLPRVGCEGRYDESKAAHVFDPVVLEMRTRLARGDRMSDSQWERALLGTEAILIRPRWPADVPLAASMSVPGWLGDAGIRARVVAPVETELHAGRIGANSCGTYWLWTRQEEEWQQIGSLAEGSHRLEIEVEVSVRDVPPDPWNLLSPDGRDLPIVPNLPVGIAWRGRIHIPVVIVPSIDAVVPPRRGSSLEEKLRQSAALEGRGGVVTGTLEGPVLLTFTALKSGFEELAETAFSLEIELWRGSSRLSTRASRIEPLCGLRPSCGEPDSQMWTSSLVLDEIPVRERFDPALLAGFEVRIRGVSTDVLRTWDARARWDGEIRIRLSDLPIGSDLLK